MAFHISNFISDPFAISTVSFGIISWIIALAGAAASNQKEFPNFSWWGIVYEIVIILLVLVLYLNNNIELYKFTLVGLFSVSLVYNTNTINWLIYKKSPAMLCCAAGCIMLSILNVLWILYFGGHPESPTNQFIDSFSLKHSHGHLPNDDRKDNMIGEDINYKAHSPANIPAQPLHFQDNNLRQSQLTHKASLHGTAQNTQPYMSSSQLNGLENFSSQDVHQRDLTKNAGSMTEITFRYKARALYSYDANPEDINEISFVKDEILEVDDIDGKWWQARRANGQVGICPSNYVKLLD